MLAPLKRHPVLVAAVFLIILNLAVNLLLVRQSRETLCESFKTTQITNYRAALAPRPGDTPLQTAARVALLHGDIHRVRNTSC